MDGLVLYDGFDDFVGNENNVRLMLRYVGARAGTVEDADDIVQNACIKLQCNWDTIRRHVTPVAYIWGTLKSAIADFYKVAKRHRGGSEDEDILLHIANTFDVESVVLIRETIREMIEETRNHKEWRLLWHIYAGFTAKEIAVILQIRPATVESQIKRLRDRLRNKRL